MYLDRVEFWEFCGANNTLHVALDTLDQLDEIDETNNAATIHNIQVDCSGKDPNILTFQVS